MRIELCVDVDANDLAILLMIARQENMPLDALIKKVIADYAAKRLAPSPTTKEEGR
jgi:hypothetical protein